MFTLRDSSMAAHSEEQEENEGRSWAVTKEGAISAIRVTALVREFVLSPSSCTYFGIPQVFLFLRRRIVRSRRTSDGVVLNGHYRMKWTSALALTLS